MRRLCRGRSPGLSASDVATALITGITGQDGSYLAEQLLREGDRVVGLVAGDRAPSGTQVDGVEIVHWDFADVAVLGDLLHAIRPTHFYNFAAYSTGAGMYDDPAAIGEFNGIAVARILQAIADTDTSIRFCQASSSEMYGDPVQVPQLEATPFRPMSPYGAAKLFAHTVTGSYRRKRGLFTCSAILYNHESPRRSTAFVTRKIAVGVARIKHGLQRELELGSLDACRDWGYAPDYVRAMRLMLARDKPGDYVVATGQTHSVREFCEVAFAHVGLDYRQYVREGQNHLRSDDRASLVGDASKARAQLDWVPEVDFGHLVRIMVDAEMASAPFTDSTS